MANTEPDLADYGGATSGSHCYEQAYKNWLNRDDPNRDKSVTNLITRTSPITLDSKIRTKTGR